MERRNIFFVGTDVDSLGGSQRVLHTLAQGLGRRGHRVELIGIRTAEEPVTYHADPAYTHLTLYPLEPAADERAPVRRLTSAKRAGVKAREVARAKLAARFAAVDRGYVVIGSPWAVGWTLAVDWPHLKGIGQYHESFEQARRSANQRLIEQHYPRLDKALFLSSEDAAAFERLRLPNAGVMPNPLSFFPAEPAPLTAPRIAAVGRLDPIKRLDRLIAAFAKVAPKHPEWVLDLVGDGPQEDELRAVAAAEGVADRVVFHGRRDDMESVYRDVSVLALSSDNEGRPMALAEAAACGVPCVSVDVSDGVRALVAHEETGLLVPKGDVAALADALDRLMGDADLRRRFGAAARTHVQPLSLERIVDRWEGLFDEIDR